MALDLPWEPWFPSDADTTQLPGCYLVEIGELRIEVTRLLNQGDLPDQCWCWGIHVVNESIFEADVMIRESKKDSGSADEAKAAAALSYRKLVGIEQQGAPQ